MVGAAGTVGPAEPHRLLTGIKSRTQRAELRKIMVMLRKTLRRQPYMQCLIALAGQLFYRQRVGNGPTIKKAAS